MMKQIKKADEPASLLTHRKKSHANYDNYPEKDDLRDSLVKEQGYICCYCMQRIVPDAEKMKIEHRQPQTKYPELQLDYQNLLASCKGNDGGPKHLPRHCDTNKGDQEITIDPVDKLKNCERVIKYRRNGRIYSDDPVINHELNDILNLNTQTLVNCREAIRVQIIKELTNIRGKKSAWTSSDIKAKIQQYENKINGKYRPFCQVVIYFLKKRIGEN
ncbi:retron system putative HNH endonuclease [Candidatus Parabeggiatoa sp. HSG14]|uniref:retron system putative HNH endonuclease n=1 Tax=Candidatus Parabeggiatoa sp. HSG14 TaxID=3055593 RepID=UPI0025A855CF|nr:retron system putative HNH endonuclease [Thiotrichales bacterium HSG14]